MYCKSLPEKSFENCCISLKIFVVCKKFEVTRKVHYISQKIEKKDSRTARDTYNIEALKENMVIGTLGMLFPKKLFSHHMNHTGM